MSRAVAVTLALLFAAAPARAAQGDAVDVFVRALEPIVQRADAPAFLALLADTASRQRALDFVTTELVPGAAHTVVQERDRQPLAGVSGGESYRLMLDVFCDFGSHARVATWRLDVRRISDAGGRQWAIADEERVSSVENIYRLTLDATRQFSAHGLKVAAEDLDLTLVDGSVFVSTIDYGVTGLVLVGRGTMTFHPAPETERGQVKLFCGAETLETTFTAAFIRINPSDFDTFIAKEQLQPVAVDARELRRAQDIFRTDGSNSFMIDLGDLSRDAWSLLPLPGDVVAEIHTRKYDTLTYARSSSEPEDITLFDRKHKHNIALYASKDRLAARGPFYDEDDLIDFDVLDYDIDVAAFPDRQWIDGRAILRLRIRSAGVSTLSLRLADPLAVQSITSREYGRLFGIRVKNQNLVVVSLPTFVPKGTQITLFVDYAGRLEPQAPDRETVQLGGAAPADDMPVMTPEKNYLYSNRSYWYPQPSVSDYASAKIRLTIPATLDCVASGELDPGYPMIVGGADGAPLRKYYVFTASAPVRYLSFIVSRFARAETETIALPHGTLQVAIEANPRQAPRAHDLMEKIADIASVYDAIVEDVPYPSFTVALVESDLPGGHSPGYFAALNQPLPTTTLSWKNDPAAFNGFPEFFIAHEMAHQWWGQAVGWQNYHEQWLSEGFAQYFAALYAQHARGNDAFLAVLKHMRRWAVAQSDQGPVYLGYRLGHIKDESRVFRALVYNKGAMVLHMLRRLVGDEAFFRGLRRFYVADKFEKAGTEDLRQAMEAESGRKLDRFFDKWVYGSTLPKVRLSWTVEGNALAVHAEQIGDLFDVPITLTLQYADRKPSDVVIAVTDRTVDTRIPLDGQLRSVDISREETLADVSTGRSPLPGATPASRTAPGRQ
ncbi:MAG TPA: M1 family aminopeptidase [Vicinamibacterales bacterium]|nr:M1 family aminopeptidase [Vicinamibacterales bacterium]